MSMGFKLIKEMTKEELIEELLAGQKEVMEAMEVDNLKRYVIHHRQTQVTKRLIEEADLEEAPWPTGLIGWGNNEAQ
jgi:hypothetical protein